MKMVTSGILTTIKLMSIPFKEWELRVQIIFPLKLFYKVFDFIGYRMVYEPIIWHFDKLNHTIKEIMVRVGFPFNDFSITYGVSMD